MKPVIYAALDEGKQHLGVCQHTESLAPDTIVVVYSHMWSSHSMMIGRAADIPWDALHRYENEVNDPTRWIALREWRMN